VRIPAPARFVKEGCALGWRAYASADDPNRRCPIGYESKAAFADTRVAAEALRFGGSSSAQARSSLR
jgi:hypothetical protein